MMAGCLLLLPAFLFAQDQVLYKLPAGPDGPGAFGAYYTIYPDATGVRAITVHSSGLHKWTEFQEGILVNQPGTLPDDNVELGAVSVANMEGEHHTYFWDENGGPPFDRNPSRANILTSNLKSELRPFALVPPTSYDYADLWTSDLNLILFDTRDNIAAGIELSEFADELVTGNRQMRTFRKKVYLADFGEEGDLSRIREAMIELSVNGRDLEPGKDYRSGIVQQLDGNKLVLWLDMPSVKAISLKISPLKQTETMIPVSLI
jgi:hypothetical protein